MIKSRNEKLSYISLRLTLDRHRTLECDKSMKNVCKRTGLKFFRNGSGQYPRFDYCRYYRDQDDQQLSIGPSILQRIHPTPPYQSVNAASAPVWYDMLLPRRAPQDITTVATLLERFDKSPPLKRDVFAEFKITQPYGSPWHEHYEIVRDWSRAYFAYERHFAAIMVLHRPGLCGSDNPNHIHVFVPARPLTLEGFIGNPGNLCSDSGHEFAWESWNAFRQSWMAQGGAA